MKPAMKLALPFLFLALSFLSLSSPFFFVELAAAPPLSETVTSTLSVAGEKLGETLDRFNSATTTTGGGNVLSDALTTTGLGNILQVNQPHVSDLIHRASSHSFLDAIFPSPQEDDASRKILAADDSPVGDDAKDQDIWDTLPLVVVADIQEAQLQREADEAAAAAAAADKVAAVADAIDIETTLKLMKAEINELATGLMEMVQEALNRQATSDMMDKAAKTLNDLQDDLPSTHQRRRVLAPAFFTPIPEGSIKALQSAASDGLKTAVSSLSSLASVATEGKRTIRNELVDGGEALANSIVAPKRSNRLGRVIQRTGGLAEGAVKQAGKLFAGSAGRVRDGLGDTTQSLMDTSGALSDGFRATAKDITGGVAKLKKNFNNVKAGIKNGLNDAVATSALNVGEQEIKSVADITEKLQKSAAEIAPIQEALVNSLGTSFMGAVGPIANLPIRPLPATRFELPPLPQSISSSVASLTRPILDAVNEKHEVKQAMIDVAAEIMEIAMAEPMEPEPMEPKPMEPEPMEPKPMEPKPMEFEHRRLNDDLEGMQAVEKPIAEKEEPNNEEQESNEGTESIEGTSDEDDNDFRRLAKKKLLSKKQGMKTQLYELVPLKKKVMGPSRPKKVSLPSPHQLDFKAIPSIDAKKLYLRRDKGLEILDKPKKNGDKKWKPKQRLHDLDVDAIAEYVPIVGKEPTTLQEPHSIYHSKQPPAVDTEPHILHDQHVGKPHYWKDVRA